MASVYGTIVCMNDQREYMSIPEVAKYTGKSETTIRRWVEKIKKLNPEAILKEDHKNYFTYKIETALVDQTFNTAQTIKQTNNRQITGNETPEGYILVHEKTFKQIQDQIETAKNNAIRLHEELTEKNRQMKQLLETNTKVSGFIADMGRQALLPDHAEAPTEATESFSRAVNDTGSTTPPVKQEVTGEEPAVKQQETTRTNSKKIVENGGKQGNNREITGKEQQTNSKKRSSKTGSKWSRPNKSANNRKTNRKQTANATNPTPEKKKGFLERLFS